MIDHALDYCVADPVCLSRIRIFPIPDPRSNKKPRGKINFIKCIQKLQFPTAKIKAQLKGKFHKKFINCIILIGKEKKMSMDTEFLIPNKEIS